MNLTQQAAALNIILELIDLNKIGFNSTIGTVFGNAGRVVPVPESSARSLLKSASSLETPSFSRFLTTCLSSTSPPSTANGSSVTWMFNTAGTAFVNLCSSVPLSTRLKLGAENVSFLEISPHPVLKSYIEEIDGNPISLVHRPNPKVPAQNTSEHFQFLEGIGSLLMTGCKHINVNKLARRSDGIIGLLKGFLLGRGRCCCFSQAP